jgi:hypothetical protein
MAQGGGHRGAATAVDVAEPVVDASSEPICGVVGGRRWGVQAAAAREF